ncbi:MAG TPA: MDR family MFS transporter [Dehalococcoidales bacterium]|nr:MDR family MFS transporter [Dehalococcoidales bacterium]
MYQSSLPKRQVVAAMVGTMLSMFLGSIFMTIAATAMPRIVTDLGGFSQYTWVFTSYIITETIALPLTGKLTDMYGRKWFFVVGMVIFTLGSFLCGMSQSMTQLIIFRAFQGIGFGVMSALGFIVIADIFPPEERGKYGGLMAGVFGLSTIIGPTLGGYLTDALSWRWCFFAPLPIGIIIILLFIFMFPQLKSGQAKHRVDYGGVIAMTLFIAPLILALTWAGVDYAWGSPVIIGLLAFSVVMLAGFIMVENRAGEPIIPLKLFKSRVVTVCSIVAFLMGAAFFPVITFIPLYFQGVLGATATASGGFLTPMMLSAAIGSFISGQLLSRAGGHYRLQGAVGFALSAVGFFLLTRMTPETSYAVAIVNIIIVGFGNGLIMPIHTIAVQNTVPYSIMGTATSMIQLLRPLGGVFGLAVVGSILNNTFASSFIGNLSSGVKAVVSPEQLAAIVDNPQALVSVEAQAQLQGLFAGMGSQGTVLFEQMLSTLRNALNSALVQVFIVFLVVTVLGLLANFFLKGVTPHGSKQGGPPPGTGD